MIFEVLYKTSTRIRTGCIEYELINSVLLKKNVVFMLDSVRLSNYNEEMLACFLSDLKLNTTN